MPFGMTQPPPLPWRIRTQFERLVLVFAASVGLVAALLLLARSAHAAHVGCVWKCLTGIPCAGCGGTRALSALVDGSLVDALAWNPGAVFAASSILAASVYAVLVLAFRLEPWRPAFLGSRWWRIAIVTGIAGNWVYLLCAGRV